MKKSISLLLALCFAFSVSAVFSSCSDEKKGAESTSGSQVTLSQSQATSSDISQSPDKTEQGNVFENPEIDKGDVPETDKGENPAKELTREQALEMMLLSKSGLYSKDLVTLSKSTLGLSYMASLGLGIQSSYVYKLDVDSGEFFYENSSSLSKVNPENTFLLCDGCLYSIKNDENGAQYRKYTFPTEILPESKSAGSALPDIPNINIGDFVSDEFGDIISGIKYEEFYRDFKVIEGENGEKTIVFSNPDSERINTLIGGIIDKIGQDKLAELIGSSENSDTVKTVIDMLVSAIKSGKAVYEASLTVVIDKDGVIGLESNSFKALVSQSLGFISVNVPLFNLDSEIRYEHPEQGVTVTAPENAELFEEISYEELLSGIFKKETQSERMM